MKNGSWPSGVTVAVLSHSTWMRPEKVSATTGPADLDSTSGCSPIGSPGKSPRFVPIPHGNKGLRSRRMPRTQVSRMMQYRERAQTAIAREHFVPARRSLFPEDNSFSERDGTSHDQSKSPAET